MTRRALIATAAGFIVVFLAGCGGGGGGGSSSPSNLPGTATITGTIKNSSTLAAIPGVTAAVSSTYLSAVTDSSGNFSISNVPDGAQTLVFSASGGSLGTDAITVTGNGTDSLGTISVSGTPNSPPSPPF